MFKPIYENDELKYKAYAKLDSYREVCIHELNDKPVSWLEERNFSEEIQQEVRISTAIAAFLKNNKSGMNPWEGIYYKNGKPNDEAENTIIYKDCGGMLINNSMMKSFYYFTIINGYYVMGTDAEKKETEDRKKVMDKLTEDKHRLTGML